jgi:hypothetical protein
MYLVRKWHLADIQVALSDVRFWGFRGGSLILLEFSHLLVSYPLASFLSLADQSVNRKRRIGLTSLPRRWSPLRCWLGLPRALMTSAPCSAACRVFVIAGPPDAVIGVVFVGSTNASTGRCADEVVK